MATGGIRERLKRAAGDRRSWLFGASAAFALSLAGDGQVAAGATAPVWSAAELTTLRTAVDRLGDDALPPLDRSELDRALWSGRRDVITAAADALAIRYATLQLRGAAAPTARAQWFIADTDRVEDLAPQLASALEQNRLEAFLAGLRPQSADYAALRAGYAQESDPARRIAIARNMERWRWMPRDLGSDYVIANAASFEVSLWRGGERAKTWRAISGKVATPTPSISATATAINFNPWWEVPPSIAVGRTRGFQQGKGRLRQPPGPGNALGRMKVIMYNPYAIYLHDTPARGLFGSEERAFSHGCMRVDDAIGFAATMLEGSRSRAQIDKLLEKPDETAVVPLARPIPVYVTYFTVTAGPDGALRFAKDIYKRDAPIVAAGMPPAAALAAR